MKSIYCNQYPIFFKCKPECAFLPYSKLKGQSTLSTEDFPPFLLVRDGWGEGHSEAAGQNKGFPPQQKYLLNIIIYL